MQLTKDEQVSRIADIVSKLDGCVSLSRLGHVVHLRKEDVKKILELLVSQKKITKQQVKSITDWDRHSADGSIHRLHKHNWTAETIAEKLNLPLSSVKFVLGMSLSDFLEPSLRDFYEKEPVRVVNLVYTFVFKKVKQAGHSGPDYTFMRQSSEGIKEDFKLLIDRLCRGEPICEGLVIPVKIKGDARKLVSVLITYNILPLETNTELKEFVKTKL